MVTSRVIHASRRLATRVPRCEKEEKKQVVRLVDVNITCRQACRPANDQSSLMRGIAAPVRLEATVVFVPRASTSTRSYYTLTFQLDPATMSLAYLQFQNHFCASIVIDQLVAEHGGSGSGASGEWRTVLPRRALMRDPHSEEDAHVWEVVSASDFDSPEWSTSGQPQVLRIFVEQPSPAWRNYKLRGMTLWGCAIASSAAAAAPPARTPVDAAVHRLLDAELNLARCFQRVAVMRRARDAIALPSDDFVRHHLGDGAR